MGRRRSLPGPSRSISRSIRCSMTSDTTYKSCLGGGETVHSRRWDSWGSASAPARLLFSGRAWGAWESRRWTVESCRRSWSYIRAWASFTSSVSPSPRHTPALAATHHTYSSGRPYCSHFLAFYFYQVKTPSFDLLVFPRHHHIENWTPLLVQDLPLGLHSCHRSSWILSAPFLNSD